MRSSIVHEARLRLGEGADPAAPGGAVTVSLCGHWDHEGPCHWPHHCRVREEAGEHVLRVVVAADDDEMDVVRSRIEAAIGRGEQTGPDGRTTTWTVVSSHPDGPHGREVAMAERLQEA
ncbi:MAG TPA: hypothetical protein VFD41_15790 [Actinomycetales bacterium]|nr:hypothetical protein [Actinomycetales bacterium]